MIALLAIMVAVLTLIAALVSVIVAIIGVFGYQTIRDEAKKRAETIATETAKRVAESIAKKMMKDINERAQASGLSASQIGEIEKRTIIAPRRQGLRTKATTDKSLKPDEGQP